MEKITWRIWESDGMGKALLIGGLLFYVPIVNLLLLGYFGRWVRALVQRHGMDLPEWHDGQATLREFTRVIGPFAVWVLVPAAAAALLSFAMTGMIKFLYFDIFFIKLTALAPFTVVAVLSPPAFTIALVRLYRTGNVRDALAVPDVLHDALRALRGALFPLLQFYGIVLVGAPLIGFAVFLAALPLLAQLVVVAQDTAEDLKSRPW